MAHETWWHEGAPSSSAAPPRPIWGAVHILPSQQPPEDHEKRFLRCVEQRMLCALQNSLSDAVVVGLHREKYTANYELA